MKKISLIFLLLTFFTYSYAKNTQHKKNHIHKSTSTQISEIKNQKNENFWDIKISTTEIQNIRQKIESQPKLRAIHLTAWVAGNEKLRRQIIEKISHSVINGVAIAIKEKDGKVYIPQIEKAQKWGSYEGAIKEPEKMVNDFKKVNLYLIARIVCFNDRIIPKKNPDMAVKNPDNSIWHSKKGETWVDPYNKNSWDYILDVAERAAQLGFDEIQFDYMRYPTEGNTSLCRFSQAHNKENAQKNIANFLIYARKRLSKYNVKISADLFGLTTNNDMGIGQDINLIAENVDYIYPMMYPSHYYSGEYNIKDPDSNPYKTINRGLKQAINKTKYNYPKIRPYLQDFSLRYKYGPVEVRSQIMALKNNMLDSWILWNPSCKYSWEALTPQMYRAFIDPNWPIEKIKK